MTNLQYEIRVLQKALGEPQYTTALGMIFYGTDVKASLSLQPNYRFCNCVWWVDDTAIPYRVITG